MDENELISKLADIELQLEAISESYTSDAHDCDDNLELKVREFGSGVHFVNQCNVCGKQRGGSIKKVEALKLLAGAEPKQFDLNIQDLYKNQLRYKSNQRDELWNEQDRILAILRGQPQVYEPVVEVYVPTVEVKNELGEVNNKLEYFIKKMTSEYGENNVTIALAKQTELLKQQKRQVLHDSIDLFTSEAELQEWLYDNFKTDFHIYPEVWGKHITENTKVRIDYIFYPREKLIASGFEPAPFGVEVKHFNHEHRFTRSTSRAFWQTISYNDCEFYLKNRVFKPKFCLLFSNLSFHDEFSIVDNHEDRASVWSGMIHVANHAKVGLLKIHGNRSSHEGWSISFTGCSYFSAKLKKGEMVYKCTSNKHVINKVRIGNFS